MKFVTDLHLHSKYSRAVSQNMTLANLALWAKYKGISVVATGDFTHPFWLEQLKNELEEKGNGLYRLRKTTNDERLTQNKKALDVSQSALSEQEVLFLLSCEISSIYSQGGQTRRIHNLFFFPQLTSVEKFNSELLKRGANLRSDGRPIVGISSRDLAEIALDSDPLAMVVPSHIWTPWFSVFGSFSGFDSIEECFGDMSQYIYAIETGLSSDPAMNWQIGDLDRRSILSFSDAHSLEKMGREATVFEGEEISYDCIYDAIIGLSGYQVIRSSGKKNPDNPTTRQPDNLRSKIAFTIEFYPEEGKYHYTGHRDCNFSQSPEESKKKGNICPVCHRPLTVGVMDRVKQLASREISNFKFQISNGVRWVYPKDNGRPPYVSLVPLGEILSEVFGVAVGTKKVNDVYLSLACGLGSEFNVLAKASLVDIKKLSGERVAEAIAKVRSRDIVVEPGYDGKFGVVAIWRGQELTADDKRARKLETQLNLFA